MELELIEALTATLLDLTRIVCETHGGQPDSGDCQTCQQLAGLEARLTVLLEQLQLVRAR